MRVFIFILMFSCVFGNAMGQDKPVKLFPAQVSFVYPLGTMGISSPDYSYNFSLNILTGSVGAINGFEVGGLLNLVRGPVNGFQAAGIANRSGGPVNGFQVAGVAGFSSGMKGFQASGVVNMINGDVKGFQTAGILNTSTNFEGLRTAGIANIATRNCKGAQISGVFNYCHLLDGFQLGVINIADSVARGISLGIINIYRQGSYDEFSIGISDYANFHADYRYGLKKFYTVYSAGISFVEDNLWLAGIGFGLNTDNGSAFYLQPELIYYSVFPNDFRHVRYTNLNILKLGMVFRIDDILSVSVDPVGYVSVEEERHGVYGYRHSMIEPVYDHNGKNSRVEIGYGIGVGFHFR